MKHFRTMLVGLGIGLGGVALGSLPGQPTLQAEGERHTVPVAVENTPTVNVRTLPAITGSVSITGQPVSVNVNTSRICRAAIESEKILSDRRSRFAEAAPSLRPL